MSEVADPREVFERLLGKTNVPKRLYGKSRALLQQLLGAIDSLREVWPLTVRQVHYFALGRVPGHENTPAAYAKVSDLLAFARLRGELDWQAIEDRARCIHRERTWEDRSEFLETEKQWTLTGYRRDRLQSQSVRPVLTTEKDALSGVLRSVANEYGVDVAVLRGQCSWGLKRELYELTMKNLNRDQHTLFLHFGDCDPEGLHIPLRAEADLGLEFSGSVDLRTFLRFQHVALTPEEAIASGPVEPP